MGITDFWVKMLVGYDIRKSEQELREYANQMYLNNTSLTQQMHQMSKTVESMTYQIKVATQKIKQQKRDLEASAKEINDLTDKVQHLSALYEKKEGTCVNQSKRIQALSTEMDVLKKENEQLKEENDAFLDMKKDYEKVILEKNALSSQLESVTSEKSSLESSNQELKEKITALENELADKSVTKSDDIKKLEEQIQKNEETIQGKNREIEILQAEQRDATFRMDEVLNQLEKEKEEKNDLLERVNALEKEKKTLQKDKGGLEKSLAELNSKQPTSIDEVGEQGMELFAMPTSSNVNVGEESPMAVSIMNEEKIMNEKLPANPDQDWQKKESDDVQDEETPGIVNSIPFTAKVHKPNIYKTKEEQILEQSGDTIEDFPPIINDSNKQTQRTITFVYNEKGDKIDSDVFFNQSAEEIARVSRKMSEAGISGRLYWTCGECRHRVKMAHRTINGKESLFFIHANRHPECPWFHQSTTSRDIFPEEKTLLYSDELISSQEEYKPKSIELKEKIFSLLTSSSSEEMGVTDVWMDEIIRSKVPYMRWRRPDISFSYKGRKIVVELQKKSHTLDTLVDRDVFFRLNDIHIIWMFGSESDSSYDYMRKVNYKNTMFDNHRNVFVFDKEAQAISEEKDILCLKCNWLNENDEWQFKMEKSGTNGKIVTLDALTYEDEFCKPFFYDANEEYFAKYPEAYKAYKDTKMSRDELKKDIEQKWTRDPNYEEAQALMRQRHAKITPYCVMNLWGFRFNTTDIIPPIFKKEPKDLYNGFYLVCLDGKYGIVNYFGEKIVDWNGLILCDDMNYDKFNQRVLFSSDNKWGVADLSGKHLITAMYQDIQNWTSSIYRVKQNGKWGLCNINDAMVADCQYEKIEELIDSKAVATKSHPTKPWITVSGYIDEKGKELCSEKNLQDDGLCIILIFELWGLIDANEKLIVPCKYESIEPWAEHLYKVKENGKWGILNVEDNSFLLPAKYDSIGDLVDGVAITLYAGIENSINVEGENVAQEIVILQNGLRKTRISGKWGIINDNGDIIVNHQYDEIGSFRSRLIGVINGKIIKLNVNYQYPIYISGTFHYSGRNCHFFNIASVECMLPNSYLKMIGKTISQMCDSQKKCGQLAFSNLIFDKKQYMLRVLKPESLTHPLSHADSKEDFSIGEELTGKITSFKTYAKQGVKHRMKAMVLFTDGRKTMVPRRFFKSDKSIENYNIHDDITLRKQSFDEDLDQTVWEIVQIK